MASNFNQSIVVLNQVVSLFIFVIAYNLDYLLLNSLPLVSFTSIFFAAINENISICNTVVKLGINIQSNFFFSSSSSFQLSGLKTETITNNYSIILKRIMHNLTLTNLMRYSVALVHISEHNSFGLIKVRSRMLMDPNSCVNTTIYTSYSSVSPLKRRSFEIKSGKGSSIG